MTTVPDLRSTIQRQDSSRQLWDVLVIGGGPSGAMAARQIALGGARVLLVDRAQFPRRKVCGCCLNSAALRILDEVGLGCLVRATGAAVVSRFRLGSNGRQVTLPIHGGIAISRELMDSMLVHAAIDSGVEFLDGTLATIESQADSALAVRLKSTHSTQSAAVLDECLTHARFVVIAGGLGCRAFADPASEGRDVTKDSRIGAGTILTASSSGYPPGTIHMACHRDGYVGLVRLEDQRLDIAAALDSVAIRSRGGIGPLVDEILEAAGFTAPESLDQANWTGTAKLTQGRAKVCGERYFVVGDAAGYVEPFTGEGMAWALASGRAVAPFVISALRDSQAKQNGQKQNGQSTTQLGMHWNQARAQLLHKRARACRRLSRLLRYPSLVNLGVWALARNPALSKPFVRSLNLPYAIPDTHE